MPVNPTDAAFVRDLVQKRAAIVLDENKHYLIEMRLERVVRERGLASVDELVSQARKGVKDADRGIIEAITTHETSFFRDMTPFDGIKQLLPALAASRGGRTINFWSAACSSGQEPYSLAMLLREQFPKLSTAIVATDISERVLDSARAAVFTQLEINRGLPAAYLLKYFDRSGVHWRVKPELRSMIDFRALNLIDAWTLPWTADIVLLRNVLIYFDVPTKRAILERLRSRLAPDGILFLGNAETTIGVHDGWEPVHAGKAMYYRRRS